MQNKLLSFFLLISSVSWSQNLKVLKGKAMVDSKDLQGITIQNISLKHKVMSSDEGLFSILAQPGDTLLFTAVQLKSKKIVIEKEDFDYLPFLVKMELGVTQLIEVVIQKNKITAESLGLVQKGTKTYTPAERKLRTAGDFKPIHLLAILGGSMPLDPIFNKINGRTDRLKKEIKIEQSELLQQQLSNIFPDDYFINELKIPNDYVGGFKVFVAEQSEMVSPIKDRNKTILTFLLGKKAVEFQKRITNDK